MPYVGRQPTPSPVTADDIPDTVEADLKSGRKNLIINGAMQVAQRGTSSAGFTNGSSGFPTNDRWYLFESGATTFVFDISQDSQSPDGFGNSFKLNNTTAQASLAAGDSLRLWYKFEGQDLQAIKKGTANAESLTLSIKVRSSKTGTYVAELYDEDNARQISASYTIDDANTWEDKEITFAGDAVGALGDDNAHSFSLTLWLAAGSNFTSGTLSTSWTTGVNANRAVGQVNLADSTTNGFYITGVQLEVGSTATDFEHRSYGEELALCQRYYQKWESTNFAGRAASTTRVVFGVPLSTPLRASPTVYDNTGQWNCYNSAGRTVMYTQDCAVNQYTVGTNSLLAQVTNFSGLTDDDGYSVGNSGSFALDAEL